MFADHLLKFLDRLECDVVFRIAKIHKRAGVSAAFGNNDLDWTVWIDMSLRGRLFAARASANDYGYQTCARNRTSSNLKHRASNFADAHRHAGGALQLAPADPCAFDRAQNSFPDAITKHRTINQPHRQNAPGANNRFALQDAGERGENNVHRQKGDDEWQQGVPCTEQQRREQKQIDDWSDGDEDDLDKADTRQTEPAERAIVPVKDHVAMFPETLQRAVSPPKPLTRKCAHTFRRFRPTDRLRDIHDSLSIFVQHQREIGVFRQCFQAQAAHAVDRALADRADGARHDRDAIPTRVGAPVEIEPAGVLERLTTRDECPQISDLRVTGNRTDASVSERFEQRRKCVALKMGVRVHKHDDAVANTGQGALQRARFPAVLLLQQTHARIGIRHALNLRRSCIARAVIDSDNFNFAVFVISL